MLEQMFDLSRKWAESCMQMQQTIVKQWMQGSSSSSAFGGLASNPWADMRKGWSDLTIDALNKHRESIDSSYKLGISTFEKSTRVLNARSPDDAMRALEDLWRGLLDALRASSEARVQEVQSWTQRCMEAQFRDVQSWTERSIDVAHYPDGHAQPANWTGRPQT